MKKISVYIREQDLELLGEQTVKMYGPAIVIQAGIEALRKMEPEALQRALMDAQAERKSARVDRQ